MGRLTEKQERFAAEVAKGVSYSAAYRIAYPASLKYPDKTVWSKGSTMAANGMVKERIATLRAPALEAAQYGVVEAMNETDRYLEMAVEDRQWGPVSAMLKHKAMLKGLLLTKLEVGGVGDFSKFNALEKVEMLKLLEDEVDRRKTVELADVTDVVDKCST
jgi:hypothetical protein